LRPGCLNNEVTVQCSTRESGSLRTELARVTLASCERGSGDPNRPVETVSWDDATNYCNQLTQREQAAARIATNSVYRLPTEAEWEYACRGWTSTRFSYGDDPEYTNLTNYAWYSDNSGDMTHPVGQKLPNPWGLYDMHGNVFEWCQDWWDPSAPATSSSRVIRGGFWGDGGRGTARSCRSAARAFDGPGIRSNGVGFRVVLAPGQPSIENLAEADNTPIAAGQFALYFRSVPGKRYGAQRADRLDGTWTLETVATATTTQKRFVVGKPVEQAF